MSAEMIRAWGVIIVAAVAATVAWAIFKAAGVDFELKESASQDTVRGLDVVVSTVAAGGAAFLVRWLLERQGWVRAWPAVGSTVLAVSMIGPSYYADGATAMALTVLHLLVGAILIAGFAVVRAGERYCPPRFEPASGRR